MSQTDLARELKVNRATIAHWERSNGSTPSVQNLSAMSRIMKVSAAWLLHGEGSHEATDAIATRALLESKIIALSKHLPLSFLASLAALLENAKAYL